MEDEEPRWAEVKRLKEEKVQVNVEQSEKTGWELLIKEDSTNKVEEKEEDKTGWELLLHQSFKNFTWSDFTSGLILCFAPTALDIGTDFNLARQTLLNPFRFNNTT